MDTLAVIAALSVWGIGGYAIGYLDGQRAELKRQIRERESQIATHPHPETTRRQWLDAWWRKLR